MNYWKKALLSYKAILSCGVCWTIALCVWGTDVFAQLHAVEFIAANAHEMRRYARPQDVPNAYVRTFDSGESIAVRMEHACCSGAGFNATVLYGSDGKVLVDTEHCFCGYEGMVFELKSIPAGSLAEFIDGTHLHFRPFP